MKLKKFKQLNNKKIGIIVFTAACVLLITGVFLYRSFALFEVIENKNLIEGNVEDLGDISFTYYIDGNIVKDSPSKDSNYMFDDKNSNCTNNATIRWNYEDWGPVVGNLSNTKTKCHLKFTSNYHEKILNGAYPVLEEPLIPVTIEDNGTVRKADLSQEWYNYTNKKWANAVISQNSYDVLSRNGLVHGATKQDGYASFDGIDDTIELGINPNFKEGFSLILRFKPYNFATGLKEMFGNWESGGGGLYLTSAYLGANMVSTNLNKTIYSKTTLEEGKIYTAVYTFDKTTFKLFLNGEFQGSTEIGASEIINSPYSMILGANPDGDVSRNHTNFDAYQIGIYNRALTEEEIKENFSSDIKIKNNEGLLKYLDFTNKEYEANEIIQEDNIESYFVWIPRYRYKIFNDGNYTGLTTVENRAQTIEVEFESKDTIPSTGTSVGSWLTHPAFTSFNTNGMWIGKFETGTILTSNFNVRNGTAIQIKPNIVSWRSIQPSNAFYTTYDYQRNLESHMMKNTEWGGVAYLQHSKYGSQSSVRINNNSNYITGYSAIKEPTCGYTASNEECNKYGTTVDVTLPYNSETGYLASTTGNISGIYDMAGGSWEYVMGMISNESGTPISGRNSIHHSGFNGPLGCPTCDSDTSGITKITNGYEWPDKRYYNSYLYSTSNRQFNRRILGDATAEMGPFDVAAYTGSAGSQNRMIDSWYADQSHFLTFDVSWFARGGGYDHGLFTGIFAFSNFYGHADNRISFRVVLSPGGSQ